MNNKNLANKLRENYGVWKSYSLEKENYFVIFNKFEKEKLLNISGNGLKLYIYLGINSNTYTGEVWHSNKTIAKYFNRSERTIRSWMKELENLNLIYRMQLNFNEESHTFLQPYIYHNVIEKERYRYMIQLKQIDDRKNISLRLFEEKIKKETYKFFNRKIYIKVTNDNIRIQSYTPLNIQINNYPKYISEKISNNINTFMEVIGKEGKEKYIFECYRNKEITNDFKED